MTVGEDEKYWFIRKLVEENKSDNNKDFLNLVQDYVVCSVDNYFLEFRTIMKYLIITFVQ